MSFTNRELPILLNGTTLNQYVSEREDEGDLVIVVIDDYWDDVKSDINALDPISASLANLRFYACQWAETRAIGFFALFEDEAELDIVLQSIQTWIKGFTHCRVRFLVDVMFRGLTREPTDYIVEKLKKSHCIPADCIAYLTQGGSQSGLIFGKQDETNKVRESGTYSSKFMAFLGIKMHEDESIDKVIKLYTQTWETIGWEHDHFDNKDSKQLQVLAKWLGICVDSASARCLMIWLEVRLGEGRLRTIDGNVLKAVLKELHIPLSSKHPIPAERFTMPCSPFLPFLVSLRSFLLCWKKQNDPVREIQLICGDEEYRFRLMMNLEDAKKFETRFCETLDKYGKDSSGENTSTQLLRYLIYCKTDGLMHNRDDIQQLFTDGTEKPVFERVEITSKYIDLIW